MGVSLLVTTVARAQSSSPESAVPASSLKGLLNDLTAKATAAITNQPAELFEVDTTPLGVLAALEVSTAPIGTSTSDTYVGTEIYGMTDNLDGLRARVIPVVGFEWAF
jgi:hypothetical protein